jgi:glycine/D-amino acid oxidase-like deaminating enzyme
MRSVWWNHLTDSDRAELAAGGQTPLLEAPSVLVVGGGLVGLCAAYYAAEQGASVQVIEAGDLASDASGASFGGVWPNELGTALTIDAESPAAALFQELAFQSRDLWGRLSVRPGFDFDWQVNGFLHVHPDRFRPSASEFTDRGMELGYTLTAVDAEQVQRLEPALAPCPAGGVLFSSEARLNPVRAAISLARGIRQKGGRVTTQTVALRLETTPEGVASVRVRTPNGTQTIHPKHLVVATGARLNWLGERSNLIPLQPFTSEAVATGPVPPLLKTTVGGRYLAMQLKSGEVIVGGTNVPGLLDAPRPEIIADMVAQARALIPALANVEFPVAWCAARPSTPDGLPILDRLPGCTNAWVATGHFRAGILLATGTGKFLADWIFRGQADLDLAPLSLARFQPS